MIQVVFQNSDFVVIDKPAGISFHSEEVPGLVVQIQAQLGVETLYPLHRLDKMTSGLVVLAFNQETAQAFQRLFESRQIDKFYLAVTDSKPKKKQGWVKGDMLPSRRGSWKLSQTQHNPAVTRFISTAIQPGERLFLIKPLTGKTHQIRVALKSLGAPICGDRRYADSAKAKQEDRGYLHAYALKFELKGQTFEFICPPKEGRRFQSEVCSRQLAEWNPPWERF